MDNLRGAALMTLAMALFAIEDALIKGLAGAIPTGQIILVIGAGGALAFSLWFRWHGQPVWVPEYLDRRVLLRSGCEMVGTVFFVSALALIPLTTASAVIQATPLVVAMGAALFLGQAVGWRRWAAILVGFAGVLLIIRPGLEGFEPATLLAVFGMLGLASRDLITRSLAIPITNTRLSWHAFTALIPAGAILLAVRGEGFVEPDGWQTLLLAGTIVIGIGAYLTITAATRAGDAAFISSFRYSRMIFALAVGYIAFSERPDWQTLAGVAIVIAAGIYTLLREARLARASHPTKAAL